MVEYAFPFSGTSPGQAGPYSADLFRLYIETLFTGLNRANAGVLLLSGDGSNEPLDVQQTSPASAQVAVKPGAALVNGGWYYTDDTVNVTIAANSSGNPRIDYIILRFNLTAQTITLVDLQGTPAGAPVPPTLTQTSTQYEIPLAQIAVANLFTTITTANINNNVRDFARKAQANEGGTGRGYNEYTNRESPIGVSGTLGWELLTAAVAESTSSSGSLAAGSWQTIPIAEGSDPDGLISVASNQITIAKVGYYLLEVCAIVTNAATLSSKKLIRLRNITDGTTTLIGTARFIAASSEANYLLHGIFQQTAANKVYELQLFSDGGSAGTITVNSPTSSGETARGIQAVFRRMTGG